MTPAVSVLVCTYEQPRELALVLAGLANQSWTDFDCWVCDDGSGPATAAVIDAARDRFAVPFHHVRHGHRGFRRAAVLNLGLRQARGRHVVFLDGDCVPHRDFVRDHAEQAAPGTYLIGRRVNLGPGLSARLTEEDVRRGWFDRPRAALLWSALTGGTRGLRRAIRIRSPRLRRAITPGAGRGLMGSNFSVARDDLWAVNGYDEGFEGYGHEDTELELRLRRLGLRPVYLKGLALQFHLWHPPRANVAANVARKTAAESVTAVRCRDGLVREGGPDVRAGSPAALPSSATGPDSSP